MDNQHFSSFQPVGFMMSYAGKTDKEILINIESSGWMFCDGRALYVREYPELYQVLGNLYGEKKEGNEIVFNIPDYRNHFLHSLNTNETTSKRPENINVHYFIKYAHILSR
jgi:microcystin-dependent protein